MWVDTALAVADMDALRRPFFVPFADGFPDLFADSIRLAGAGRARGFRLSK
jgi:hypothetical protein